MKCDQIDNNIINSNYSNNDKNTLLKVNELKKNAIYGITFEITARGYITTYCVNSVYNAKQKITSYYNKSKKKSWILLSMIIELENLIELINKKFSENNHKFTVLKR